MTSWATLRLADAGTWLGGGTPSKSNPAYWVDGDVPWLSPKDMGEETLSGTRDRITEAAVASSAVKRVPAGSVAVVARSGILERTLPTAVVPFETTLNQDMKALVPHTHIIPAWVAWFLRAREQWVLENARKAGTTVASLEWKKFLSLKIPVPPTAEQRRIVDLLEDHLSRLDAGKRYTSAAARRSTVLFERAVAGHLVAPDAVESTLGAVAAWGSGGTPSARTSSYYDGGSIPWLNSGDLSDADILDAPKKITELGLAKSSAKWVPTGSVLVAMYGATIGLTGLTREPVTTNQAIAFATPREDVSAEWLQWFIRSQRTELRLAGQGGAQPNISQTVLKAWPVKIPPMERQLSQVAACEQLETQVRQLGSALDRARTREAALRRALLNAAFAGQLDRGASDL